MRSITIDPCANGTIYCLLLFAIHASGLGLGPVWGQHPGATQQRILSMKKSTLLPLALVAAFGLAACSENAQNETSEAADAVAADMNSTMSEAAADVDAATDSALQSAENAIDRTGQSIENGADRAAAESAEARREAGRELEEAGRDMQR
ncbi:hypothetical protein [Sphingomonas sp.]